MRRTNIEQFNKELFNASKKVEGDIVQFFKLICIEAFRRIVMRTPVDTGRCRGNWQIEFNQPSTISITNKELWNTVLIRELVKLNKLTSLKDLVYNNVVYLTNNVNYAYYLEYIRRSKQAPSGFVEITLQELRTFMADIK